MLKRLMLTGQLVLAVDFDGTISDNPDMGNVLTLQPNCKEVLKRFKEEGIRLTLWTCRSGGALDEAEAFLRAEGLWEVFDTINDQLPEIREKYTPDVARKVGADFYLDDKNIFTFIYGNYWLEAEAFIMEVWESIKANPDSKYVEITRRVLA